MKDAALDALRELIAAEGDVKAVHRLVRVNGERFLYLIETPFESFPRFVVGLTDSANGTPEIIVRCNKLMSAQIHFDDARLEYGLPPAD